mmetsp:Transcript_89985/g.278312  ORF Transcript_89985/g.278312 Transcript_89985/m.278312 type:complete len:246 (+) Transcript_89985:324-1061(+)
MKQSVHRSSPARTRFSSEAQSSMLSRRRDPPVTRTPGNTRRALPEPSTQPWSETSPLEISSGSASEQCPVTWMTARPAPTSTSRILVASATPSAPLCSTAVLRSCAVLQPLPPSVPPPLPAGQLARLTAGRPSAAAGGEVAGATSRAMPSASNDRPSFGGDCCSGSPGGGPRSSCSLKSPTREGSVPAMVSGSSAAASLRRAPGGRRRILPPLRTIASAPGPRPSLSDNWCAWESARWDAWCKRT